MQSSYMFDYRLKNAQPGSLMPRLRMQFRYVNTVDADGLLDSGATINILPFSVGVALGAIWEQAENLPVTGAFGAIGSRALVITAFHPQLTTRSGIEFAFAWAADDRVPVIFGQFDFFEKFRVCFDARNATFEIFPNAS